jgi:hypothetical protein
MINKQSEVHKKSFICGWLSHKHTWHVDSLKRTSAEHYMGSF